MMADVQNGKQCLSLHLSRLLQWLHLPLLREVIRVREKLMSCVTWS